MVWVTLIKQQIFFWFVTVSQHSAWNKRRPTRRHYKAIYFIVRYSKAHCYRFSENIAFFIFKQCSVFRQKKIIRSRGVIWFLTLLQARSSSVETWAAIEIIIQIKRKLYLKVRSNELNCQHQRCIAFHYLFCELLKSTQQAQYVGLCREN